MADFTQVFPNGITNLEQHNNLLLSDPQYRASFFAANPAQTSAPAIDPTRQGMIDFMDWGNAINSAGAAQGIPNGDPRLPELIPTPAQAQNQGITNDSLTYSNYLDQLGFTPSSAAPAPTADGGTPAATDPNVLSQYRDAALQSIGAFIPPVRLANEPDEGYNARQQAAYADWSQRLSTEQDRLRQDALDEQQRATTAGLIDTASGDFTNQINQLLSARGYDPNIFSGGIDRALSDIRQSIDPLSENPSQFFTNADTVTQGIVDQQRGFDIDRFTRQYQNTFPQFFEKGAQGFADTFDDPFINSFLDTRFSDASGLIDNAFKRGNLNQTGYDRAFSDLQNQRTAANSQLQLIGGDILDLNRNKLTGIADRALTDIGNYDFGNFSFDPYKNEIANTRQDLANRFEGDFLSQVNGMSFFNPNTSLNFGGQAQGAINSFSPSPEAITAALSRRQADRSQGRGVGSQGAF